MLFGTISPQPYRLLAVIHLSGNAVPVLGLDFAVRIVVNREARQSTLSSMLEPFLNGGLYLLTAALLPAGLISVSSLQLQIRLIVALYRDTMRSLYAKLATRGAVRVNLREN
jgi:hypothetical protein